MNPSRLLQSGERIDFADFAGILDVVGQAVILKDEASRFLHLNAGARALLNVSLESVRGRTDHDFLPRQQADRIRAMDLQVLRDGLGRTFEEEITVANGSPRTLVTHKHAVTLSGGSPGKLLVAVISDVTELRTAERVLRASEEHYRSLVELLPQIAWTADAKGAVTEVGPGWLDIAGAPLWSALGSGWEAALHPDDLEGVREQWHASIRSGEAFDVECRIGSAVDGEYRWFRNRAAPRRDENNTVVRWCGLLEDVHQRVATDALRESEALFRLIADSVPVMMWLTDQTADATYHSRLWLELTGLSEAEALGSGWSLAIHPDDRAQVLDSFESATKIQAPVRLEYRLRRANGSWAWVIDTGAPRLSPNGVLLGYAGSILDISERRAAELALRESEAAIRGVFDSSPDCIRMLDLDAKPLLMNKAGREILGLAPSDLVEAQTWERIFSQSDLPKLYAALETVRAGGTARLEASLVDALGNHRCMDVIAAPVLGSDSMPSRMVTIWRDITEAKATRVDAEKAHSLAEEAAARLADVLDSTMDCVLVVDRSWRVVYLNENARRLLSLGDDAMGADLWALYPDEASGPFHEHYRRALESHRAVSFEEYAPSLKIWLEVHASPTQDGLSIFFRDTSARREAEQERFQAQKEIYHMSRHDALTGLPNRVLFRDTVEQQLSIVRPGSALAVLTLDLDGFKAVNDAYGHHAGDVLLRQVAERLRRCVGEDDFVARLGGDEFVISMPAMRVVDEATDMAQRLVAVLSETFELDALHVNIGTSVGIAIAPADGIAAEQLTKASDVALYRAKAAGRGAYCRYISSMDADLQIRQALKLSLRQALAKKEFEVHYQPLVGLKKNEITSCEALIRWHHPDKGMISPADFIPLAEETGLIVQIGEWVLGEACRQAATWPQEISVAVNLSPVQFKSNSLVDVVKSALNRSGIAASRLQLEITESVLLDEDESNLHTLQEIRQLGVKIAMDDFGTGYSSLGYLRNFPFDKIKVDGSFISDLPNGKESLAIVRAVAGIGRSLGITTTVEGVETKDQLGAISIEGFDEAQGYLFTRPLSATNLLEFILAERGKGSAVENC